jgi:hypothetical protein
MQHSRRDFIGLAIASVPAAAAFGAAVGQGNAVVNGVRLGVLTYSFRWHG